MGDGGPEKDAVTAATLAARTEEHLIKDGLMEGEPGGPPKEKEGANYFSHVPTAMYELMELMYRRACTEHNVVLNRGHLAVHGFTFNLRRALELYQTQSRRCQVNKMIKTWCDRLRGLGKRFSSKAMLDAPPAIVSSDEE